MFVLCHTCQVGDGVLDLLQEIADVGLSYYPERLGQLLIVNVSIADAAHLTLVARALGFGAAVNGGRLHVLPGELPKWAPDLLKVRGRFVAPVSFKSCVVTIVVLRSTACLKMCVCFCATRRDREPGGDSLRFVMSLHDLPKGLSVQSTPVYLKHVVFRTYSYMLLPLHRRFPLNVGNLA